MDKLKQIQVFRFIINSVRQACRLPSVISGFVYRGSALGTTYRGRYFFGVANKVYLEFRRRKSPQPPLFTPPDPNQIELEFRCMERCIETLSEGNRYLLLQYYGAEGSTKVEQRKRLAEELGIAPNALRIRAFRIRVGLQECMEKCIKDELG